ncbi:hypothetical protein [Helicobacter valdiviensis]|nr:hypothetical protein [Helicobacter valdiviensis]
MGLLKKTFSIFFGFAIMVAMVFGCKLVKAFFMSLQEYIEDRYFLHFFDLFYRYSNLILEIGLLLFFML